jgi:hypothetical protein
MVTECFGYRVWDMTDSGTVFLATAFDISKLLVPAALCLLLWRATITNKSAPVMLLGLEYATAEAYKKPTASRKQRLAYAITAMFTFVLGVMAYEFIG